MTSNQTSSVLQFDAENHIYTLGGRLLPSVTQVLEDCRIIDYSQLPFDTRMMALERGRFVHTATQLDDEFDLDEASVPDLLPYVEAWRRFREAMDLHSFDLIEHRMHDPLGFAGTLDRYVISGGILIDIKTSLAPWWVRIQLAAYKQMLDQEYTGTARRLAVELHKDASFRIIEFPIAEQRHDFQTFLAALRIWQEKQQHKRRGI